MGLKHAVMVAGMAVTATAGLAAPAWAAPADSPVTERQCFNGDGRVQREADGVGTCVGGTNDGMLIDDGVDHTDRSDDTASRRSSTDSDSGYGRSRLGDDDSTTSTDRYGRDDDSDSGYDGDSY